MASLIGFFFGAPGPLQLLMVAAIILLLFGHRLPGTMRSLGKGITEFKKGLRDDSPEDEPKLEDQSAESAESKV